MSDSAEAIGFSGQDSRGHLDLSPPSFKPTSKSTSQPLNKPDVDRLSFPSADLGRLRTPVEDQAADAPHRPGWQMRKRKREKERARQAAERVASLLAIDEDLENEHNLRKRMKVLLSAWAVALLINFLILGYLALSVASWATDEKAVTLVFSNVEVDAEQEEETQIDFSLPVVIETEAVETEEDPVLVEMLSIDTTEAMDWSEDPEPLSDHQMAEGLFEDVDVGAGEGQGKGKGEDKGEGASFFGIKSSGDRLVYVVDSSGSMGHERRFQRAIYELSRSLQMMEKHQQFLVVLYNDAIYPMLDTPLSKTKPLKATPGNIKRVLNWLELQRPGGSTLPARAIQGALELQPSSIFLLSDGELADNTIGLLRKLNVANSGAGIERVPVHTITLGSTGIGAGMMQQIANENEGQFVWVK